MSAPSPEERAALRALCVRALPEYGEEAALARLELGRARGTVLAVLDALESRIGAGKDLEDEKIGKCWAGSSRKDERSAR